MILGTLCLSHVSNSILTAIFSTEDLSVFKSSIAGVDGVLFWSLFDKFDSSLNVLYRNTTLKRKTKKVHLEATLETELCVHEHDEKRGWPSGQLWRQAVSCIPHQKLGMFLLF